MVASAVGGIPAQGIHKHTGMLAHPELAARLGQQAHEHVREQFLITCNVKRYLSLFLHLRGSN